jgi:hypothetical protein
MSDPSDPVLERLDAIAAVIEQIGEAMAQQRDDLHVALEVLVEIGAKLDRLDGPAPTATPAATAARGLWRRRGGP